MIKGAILALAATLSACGSPNQSQTAALDSARFNRTSFAVSVTQANAPLNQTQTNQPASTFYKGFQPQFIKTPTAAAVLSGSAMLIKQDCSLLISIHKPSAVKDRYEVPEQMRSCHTTVTSDGFVFEGHILLNLYSS